MLFDWIMTTFTGGQKESTPTLVSMTSDEHANTQKEDATSDQPLQKLRVKVKLTEVRGILNDDGVRLATLSLQAADVSVLLRGPSMRIAARLGNLSLTDDYESSGLPIYKQLLTIEGDNLADFQYEKYDSADPTYPGYDSLIFLRSGSFRFFFMEEAIHRILRFLTKFSHMKAVYDASANAAAQQATGLQGQASRMHYDILIRTPILVFPRKSDSTDIVIANLGEMSVNNSFSQENGGTITEIDAALSQVRLSSESMDQGKEESIQMLKNLDLKFKITMIAGIHRDAEKLPRPDTEVPLLIRLSEMPFGTDVVCYGDRGKYVRCPHAAHSPAVRFFAGPIEKHTSYFCQNGRRSSRTRRPRSSSIGASDPSPLKLTLAAGH